MNLQGTAYHPDFDQLVTWEASVLSDDPDTQVAQTINRMRGNVKADTPAYPIQRDAQILQMSSSGDPCSDAFWFDKGRVGFAQDERLAAPIAPLLDGDVVEVLIRPRDLADMRGPLEDCDGFASLTATRLRAMGVPCNFVTIAADARDPDRYSHVYLACYPNGRRVPLDVSHGAYPGWEAPNVYGKKKEWPIDGIDWSCLLVAAALAAAVWLLWRGGL